MDSLKLRGIAFGCGALLGAVGAVASHTPVRWSPLIVPEFSPGTAPAPAAEPVPPPQPVSADLLARQQAFAAVRDKVISVGQDLRRVEAQIQLQRSAYEDFMRRSAPFDLPAWHARQQELAQEHEAFRAELARANAEYERYVCKDGRARAECWH